MAKIKKLRRPKKGRVIAGVAQGMANYFDIDVVLVRLIWVFLLLPGGIPGIIPYLICWLVIPSK
jgi:phage shock protein PspC (stress-responsive transcriptional regulator)